MNRGLSLHLDAWRVCAALTVAVIHATHPIYLDGGPNLAPFAADAVIVFFVISGFVISHAARRPGTTAAGYAFDRATRLFSVAVPALAVTLILDGYGRSVAPEAYVPAGPEDFLASTARALGFFAHWSIGDGRSVGTNSPWWSLSYEVAYYILFFGAMFLRGWRRWLWLAAGVVLFGPKVMILAPAWALGVFAERVLAAEGRAARASWIILAAAPFALYAASVEIGFRDLIWEATFAALGPERFAALGYSRYFLWDWWVALLFTLHLVAAGRLWAMTEAWEARPIRWLAGATFSIYLTHLPVIHLMNALGDPSVTAAVAVAIIHALVFASVFERPLPQLRRLFRARLMRSH